MASDAKIPSRQPLGSFGVWPGAEIAEGIVLEVPSRPMCQMMVRIVC